MNPLAQFISLILKHIEMISKSQTDEQKQKGKDKALPLLF